jgi:FtsH-binding integral membrane protein
MATPAPASAPFSVPASRTDTGSLVGHTMTLVALTTATFAAGAYLGADASGALALVCALASLGVLFALQAAVSRSESLAVGLLLAFGLLIGLSTGSAIAYYVESDPAAVWQAGAATALFVAGFGAAGYATKRDLSILVRILLWALVGLIALGVIAIFVQIPGGALVYSILGLVIFAGLIAVDFQRLRRLDDVRSAPVLAASIFLDILNVFTLFLPIFGGDER